MNVKNMITHLVVGRNKVDQETVAYLMNTYTVDYSPTTIEIPVKKYIRLRIKLRIIASLKFIEVFSKIYYVQVAGAMLPFDDLAHAELAIPKMERVTKIDNYGGIHG